jgi:hypothetical protein
MYLSKINEARNIQKSTDYYISINPDLYLSIKHVICEISIAKKKKKKKEKQINENIKMTTVLI